MKYLINFSLLKNLLKRYPMLDLSNIVWDLTEDYFYSANPENETCPFANNKKEIMHRVEADLQFSDNFNEDNEKFLEKAEKFFDKEFTVFENKRHLWMLGTLGNLEYTNCDNGPVIQHILHESGMAEYFKSEKWTIGIPFGKSLICFVSCGGNLFLDIPESDPSIKEVLERDLELNQFEKTNKSWAEISFENIKK